MDQPSPWYEHSDPPGVPSPEPPRGRLGRWRVAALAGTGSLALAGALVGYTLSGSAGADPSSAGQQTTTTAVASQPSTADRAQRRADRLKEVLQPLVDAGTITAAQRDAVVKQLLEAVPANGGDRGGHRFGNFPRVKALGLVAAGKVLGMSGDELRAALRNGSSLADIAKSKGIDVNKVIDDLVKESVDAMSKLDPPAGVTLPTEAQLRERITAFVNGEFPKGLGGREHRRGAAEDHGRHADTTTTTVK